MKQIVFILFLLLLILIASASFLFFNNVEGYSNYRLDNAMGEVPQAETQVLVQDTYPRTGKNEKSDESSSDIWTDYPVYTLGSYEQITNNIRYPKNPDNGTCMPASMCNVLYEDKVLGNNVITPLPPLNPECGTRVGYFTAGEQLIDSLPYNTNMQNILF
jgi:uncharacterized protein YxeA